MDNAERITIAIALLKSARDHLKAAGARQTLARVRSAIKSAEGAHRNAVSMKFRPGRTFAPMNSIAEHDRDT